MDCSLLADQFSLSVGQHGHICFSRKLPHVHRKILLLVLETPWDAPSVFRERNKGFYGEIREILVAAKSGWSVGFVQAAAEGRGNPLEILAAAAGFSRQTIAVNCSNKQKVRSRNRRGFVLRIQQLGAPVSPGGVSKSFVPPPTWSSAGL